MLCKQKIQMIRYTSFDYQFVQFQRLGFLGDTQQMSLCIFSMESHTGGPWFVQISTTGNFKNVPFFGVLKLILRVTL